MIDTFQPILSGLAGTYVLVWLLPTACVLGIGLVIVGLSQGRASLVVGGIAFPLAALLLGMSLQASGLSDENAPANLGDSVASVASYLPFALGVAALIFLFAVLPAIVKVARR